MRSRHGIIEGSEKTRAERRQPDLLHNLAWGLEQKVGKGPGGNRGRRGGRCLQCDGRDTVWVRRGAAPPASGRYARLQSPEDNPQHPIGVPCLPEQHVQGRTVRALPPRQDGRSTARGEHGQPRERVAVGGTPRSIRARGGRATFRPKLLPHLHPCRREGAARVPCDQGVPHQVRQSAAARRVQRDGGAVLRSTGDAEDQGVRQRAERRVAAPVTEGGHVARQVVAAAGSPPSAIAARVQRGGERARGDVFESIRQSGGGRGCGEGFGRGTLISMRPE
mmetsp:Transcript_18395/g.28159  ORF Transcript_18395/g.28159 Transcript_18395/m.28159 type:complete len:278 (+) Transcript_18395:238-1071(+)